MSVATVSSKQMRTLQYLEMAQRLGLHWVAYRGAYSLRRKTGLLQRKFPTSDWDRVTLADLVRPGVPSEPSAYKAFRGEKGGAFFFPAGELPTAGELEKVIGADAQARAVSVADDYCRGRFLYFSSESFDLGRPPNWLLNPYTGGTHHTRTHWCDYPTFSPELGDIKEVWEPSRFACAYWLARAYALTREEKYPQAFWDLFESWASQNPPNLGPNWKCGQETGIRLFGWAFALYAFWNSPSTTPDRVASMARLMAIQAERIYHNIDFAISQKNNHSMSEAIGMMTVALLFPEFREARKWFDRGEHILESDVRRQIYDDGSFVQHSTNYHRVMLHDCLWSIRLCEVNGRPLSAELVRRVGLAAEWLFEMMDTESGSVPNYGANDGALVLPLSSCPYEDFRATVQAGMYLKEKRRALPDGPWNEMTRWLYGSDAFSAAAEPRKPTSRRFDAGGYYTVRGADSWCMVRCHSYADRPAHVDMLHVDLWHRGENVLSDSGSYKYFAPESPGAEKYFKDIRAHNTVEIGGRGPLDLASRFLWLPWPEARVIEHGGARWVGEHDGYARSPWHVTHRRMIEHVGGVWTVSDELSGHGEQLVTLRWHLADYPYRIDEGGKAIVVDLPKGTMTLLFVSPVEMKLSVKRGVETAGEVSGWSSRHYRKKTPRPTVELTGRVTLPLSLSTRINFHD
ncbi:MAG: alginate lyase family protein [Planctomycetes bacterium]|nr:alginate lyase family protein [Planctomycetota bacterium]